jgi:quinol monooxygenase YgiN
MSKVKHITLVQFKEGTSETQVEQIFEELLDATENIPGIEDYVSGRNCSPLGQSQGFSHAMIMTFADIAARDAYLAHPEQQRIKAVLEPQLHSMLVFDFEL